MKQSMRTGGFWVLAFLVGCGIESTPRSPVVELPEPGQTVSGIVGVSGGSLAVGEAEIVIPPAALAADTEIRVTVLEGETPEAFRPFSPVFRFEPAGLEFAEPFTVRLPFDGEPESATIFWTSHGSGSYMALPTTVVDGYATAQVTHFSEGFVGSGCTGEDCCDSANGRLDVVLLVDNSNSMQEEQAALAAQIPRMARVLATGDLDGDGVQDFPALESVRVGVVSSDMGTGGYAIQTCDEPMSGDDGVLLSDGHGDTCAMSYPSFAELSADDDAAAVEEFVHHVECVAEAGTGGCGFEQQLEAIYAATSRQSEPGRPNAGFLRDDSLVAFILLTDEDDCSSANPEIFNPARDDFGPLNVRCPIRSELLQPVDRYIEGLQSIRTDPADVIFSVVAGVPLELVDRGASVDEILADGGMEPQIDPANPNELLPSCDTAVGRAYPPRRMVEVAQGFGGNGVVQSICQDDFSSVVGSILERVAARASGVCL